VSPLWKKITPSESIGEILFIAPMAICHHLKILSSIPAVNDSLSIFKSMPIFFTSAKNFSASETLFKESIYETAGDDTDVLFYSKNSCTSHDHRIGEYCFYEAIKVDLAESEAKHQKIFQALCIYFAYYLRIWDVLLNCMQNLWMRLLSYILWAREIISSMDKKKEMIVTIFLGQGIINEGSSDNKEYLQLYESWCLFAYREFYKNLLATLDELSLKTFG
jgi:hypothetical protein